MVWYKEKTWFQFKRLKIREKSKSQKVNQTSQLLLTSPQIVNFQKDQHFRMKVTLIKESVGIVSWHEMILECISIIKSYLTLFISVMSSELFRWKRGGFVLTSLHIAEFLEVFFVNVSTLFDGMTGVLVLLGRNIENGFVAIRLDREVETMKWGI